MCAHPATCSIVLCHKPHPSGARVDLNKSHEASGKHCLSQVWRWSPSDAPSADRHDKQFLCERRRAFGSRLEKSPALSQTTEKYLQQCIKKERKPARCRKWNKNHREVGMWFGMIQSMQGYFYSDSICVYAISTTSNSDWCRVTPPPQHAA